MPFKWLKQFHSESKKSPDYAEKTLQSYARGIKAGGSIRGVRIAVHDTSCEAAQRLPHNEVYLPEEAPRLPLKGCPLGEGCRCVYRPVMDYEEVEDS
jgi:hypothetical protein